MKSVNWFILVCLAFVLIMANGCLMGDEGNPTGTAPATGGTSAGGATNTECVSDSTEKCNCSANSINGTRSCTNGIWGECGSCVATECNPGATQVCDCSPTSIGGSRTCSASGVWGACDSCSATDCTPGSTDSCDCSPSSIGGSRTCNSSGSWSSCSSCTATECNPGASQACNCSATSVGGTRTCASNGVWGACGSCSATECTPNTTASCNCSSTSLNGNKTCSATGSWGSCSGCTSAGPVACANLTGITEWVDVTLTETTTETSVVQFQGVCGNYDTATKKWINVSDWTVVPGCESKPVVNGVATCQTRRPKAYADVEANAYLNNGYWAVGVLTNTQAQEVCPGTYSSTTKTCSDLWAVQRFHGTMTIGGKTCTASNAVVNGNNDSFNCRITL